MRHPLVLSALVFASAGGAMGASPLSAGTYRLEMSIASHASMPLLGKSESTTVSISLVELRALPDGLRQSHRVCDARLEGSVPFVRLEMPPQFIAALGTRDYPITLVADADGWRYRADLGVEHVGWRPDDGPLPTRVDDPRIYDWDGDGRPAATLRLAVPIAPDGELLVVQRGHSVLEGGVVGRDRVAGRIDVRHFEQAVVAARPAFLRRSPAVTQDPARSRFTLERVADGTTCAELVRAEQG
jgi:hypothetical protein